MNSSNKPVVHFDGKSIELFVSDSGNLYAKVYAFNHPRLGEEWVRTSTILTYIKGTGFETLNTLYIVKEVY